MHLQISKATHEIEIFKSFFLLEEKIMSQNAASHDNV